MPEAHGSKVSFVVLNAHKEGSMIRCKMCNTDPHLGVREKILSVPSTVKLLPDTRLYR